MTNVAVTNTFVDQAIIEADEHNQNFSDLVTWINQRNSGSATWDACSIDSSTEIPLIVNNGTGTFDIVNFQDNGTNVFVVANGGSVTMDKQPAARAYRSSSNQTVTDNSTTKVQFNGESYDVRSEFDSATNYRYTVTTAGKYVVTATLLLGTTASAKNSTIYIYKNGSEFSRAAVDDLGTYQQSIGIFEVMNLAAADYIEIYLNANTTGGQSTDVVAGTESSYFAIHKVA